MRKILIKDVKKFMGEHIVLYASMDSRRFYIALRAAPYAERYGVITPKTEKWFVKLSEAVRFFNNPDA